MRFIQLLHLHGVTYNSKLYDAKPLILQRELSNYLPGKFEGSVYIICPFSSRQHVIMSGAYDVERDIYYYHTGLAALLGCEDSMSDQDYLDLLLTKNWKVWDCEEEYPQYAKKEEE